VIIVSDSGPLAYLVEIGVADHLPALYGNVLVPPTVISELRHERSPVLSWAIQPPSWLVIASPKHILHELLLDEGEREAISLALEVGADLVLMDERKGRAAARSHNLKVAGTLAVILDGHSQRLFNGLQALKRLEQTNFYAAAELIETVRAKLSPD
jgi:predicted nucleic acid-binding protein